MSDPSRDDLTLLRQYEPLIRYTSGEHFFPMDVARYVARSALWFRPERAAAVEVIPRGNLEIDRLGLPLPYDDTRGIHFLQFAEPLAGRALQHVIDRRRRTRFRGRGRLARVGLVARLVDAFFTVSLWLRGTVPGGTAAAAEVAYGEMMAEREAYPYYGRVLRQEHYVILHYLFFYCMNDWRSSFHGVNDHEADWEQVVIYLEDCEGSDLRPIWIACAAHDDHGDDRRRHWDDPEVEKVAGHPVIYAGAGSHASYFIRGEYLVKVRLSVFRPLLRTLETALRFWRVTLRQGDPDEQPPALTDLFGIPFVDYARGDGVSIGPTGDQSWTPILLDPVPAWIERYRGLWGFFAQDPVSGENAPAGPKFNRDGTVRRAWHNPLGWSGLQKVAPDSCIDEALRARLDTLRAAQAADREAAAAQHAALVPLHAEMRALDQQPQLAEAHQRAWAATQEKERALLKLTDRIAERDEVIHALERRLAAVEAGDRGPLRDHLVHPDRPQTEHEIRVGAWAESWAAFSVGLLLVGFVALYLTEGYRLVGLGLLIGLFALIEAVFQRRLESLIVRVTLGLSLFASLVLIYDYFWEIVIAAVFAVALIIIADNLRELRE